MTIGIAILLLVLAVAGIILETQNLRKETKLKKVYITCLVLLWLIALALFCYIGISIYFVDAVRNQPPA